MTEKLYDLDSHLKEFDAKVISCENYGENFAVVLNKTAFFPEGGGQKSDKGFIDNSCVLDVQIINDEIIHITDSVLQCGATVHCTLDWERRFDFMQQHSGEHIVSGVAHKLYGCENVGFHLSEDIVTLDFDKPLSPQQILKIETESNEAVFKNVAFNTYYPDSVTLEKLNYRSKKELTGDIRIVEIENTDVCACCAPHVKKSGEIGLIKLLSSEKLRGGVRIELKAGKRALYDYNEKYDNIHKISNKLCVKQTETAYAVDKLQENLNSLNFKLNGVKKELLLIKAQNLKTHKNISCHFEDGLEMKDLIEFANMLFQNNGSIRAVFSPANDGFYFAICGEENELTDFFAKFKECFQTKGGGRGNIVQGTVFCSKSDILQFMD